MVAQFEANGGIGIDGLEFRGIRGLVPQHACRMSKRRRALVPIIAQTEWDGKADAEREVAIEQRGGAKAVGQKLPGILRLTGLPVGGLELGAVVNEARCQLEFGLGQVRQVGGILLDGGSVIDLSNAPTRPAEVESSGRRIAEPLASGVPGGEQDC